MRKRAATLLALPLLLAGCAALDPPATPIEARLQALPQAGMPISAPVEIRWNAQMVPWITASTDTDMAFALGLVQGHLRGAQVQLLRLVATGRLAEVAGPFATDIDHALRILGFGRAAPAIIAAWPPETRAFMESFRSGLNTALAQSPPPRESGLLGLSGEPLTMAEILAIGRLAGTDINWLGFFSLLPARGQPDFPELWARTREAGGAPGTQAQAEARLRLFAELLGGTGKAGSNSVAVGAARSATGGALIGNDPHLGMNLPNAWMLVGMRSPSFHAVGLTVPGLPILGVGRNPDIAWGGTNLRAASSDLFEVSGQTLTEETTRIRQRFWFTAERRIRLSPQGPVMTDAALVPATPGQLALRWVGHAPTDEVTALLRASRARSGEELQAAFAGFGVSAQTMVWAGRDGRVGRFIAATLPDRVGFPTQDIALDGRDPAATGPWDRLRDSRTLPAQLMGPDGAIASANNRPRWAEGPGQPPLGFFFSDDDRVLRLEALLAATPRHTPESIAAIQRDIVSPRAAALAAALRARLIAAGAAPTLAAALAGWDGAYAAESRVPVAFELLLKQLVPALAPASRRDAAGNPRGAESQWNFLTRFLLADLDALPPAERAELLNRAGAAAEADFARLGSWGEVHRLRAAHWLVNLPLLGRAFVYGDFPVGGSRETPMKTSHGLLTDGAPRPANFGAMARHVSDMSDPDANWFTLWGGNDGWLGSSAFNDQMPLWREGRSIRLPLTPAAVARDFPRLTRLLPR
jgi:penicillin amidase